MRNNLLASLQLMVREQQLRASVDQRVLRRAKQLASSKSTHALEEKHVAPSTYQQHVAPVLGDLDVCTPANWRQCIVKEGRGVCEAGSKCKEARAVLGWPDDLACVDPNTSRVGVSWDRPLTLKR